MTTAMTSAYQVGRTSAHRRSPITTPDALRKWCRHVTLDLILVIVIAGILGAVGSVLAGPLTGAAFALVAAASFRVVLQTINP
ncbi:hypothetical protein [Rhodococcus qingshengii]|uniref:hypothetical protein n=1 Tax=Rhodococcus qingshengii TaxID=334542 RepID=UPI0002B7C7F2|nr:hypothetical protein [Rhodococcus qingshengii]EME16557.1 hypothetical protein G418_25508 [Rhodococcus qingshengii BKS 20-40]